MSQQQRKMNDIQVEIASTTRQLEDNFIKIQERGELMDHLQAKTGESLESLVITFHSSLVAMSKAACHRGIVDECFWKEGLMDR